MTHPHRDTPFSGGPFGDGTWVPPDDAPRVARHNARLPPDDPRRVLLRTPGGAPFLPNQWAGDPWTAPVLLLMMNPSTGRDPDALWRVPRGPDRVADMLRGRWDPDYPNAWLHPDVRSAEGWHSGVVLAAPHRALVADGTEGEAAWRRLASRVAVLELSPLTSRTWSPGAYASTTRLAVELAAAAASDPDRRVLLCRGEGEWRAAGLLDVDELPKSRGVRAHQCRLSPANFPDAWCDVMRLIRSEPHM